MTLDIGFLFRWSTVIVSLAITSVGLAFTERGLVAIGAVFGLPFLAYLGATPRFAVVAPSVAALYIAAAVLAWRGHWVLSALAFGACVAFFGFVASDVWRGY